MEDTFYKELVPENVEGKSNDLEESVECKNEEDCNLIFKKACERMLDINSWHQLTNEKGASFCVMDDQENLIKRIPRTGDYVRINIPGPGTKDGGGYDWVKVNAIKRDDFHQGISFRSCKRPQKNDNDTDHFFDSKATSTFIITRKPNEVIASYHGRNEKINIDNDSVIDKIRNVVVGIGALLGFSEIQWKTLISAFLGK